MADLADRRIRVLIADDHQLFAQALMTSLAVDERVEIVGIARDGAEAVELTLEYEPDLVLMDLRMPVLDGCEATRKIRAAGSRAQVILLTGSEIEMNADKLREVGAAAFLMKQQTLGEFLDAFYEVASLTIALGAAQAGVAAR